MIDQTLRKKLSSTDALATKIDYSWREMLRSQRRSLKSLPFDGEYECIVKNDGVLILGWQGDLVINKLYNGVTTFSITNPFVKKKFKIYSAFDFQKNFQCFISDPVWGFHHHGSTLLGKKICLGDITTGEQNTLKKVRNACEQIASGLKIINTRSLGNINVVSKKNSLIVRMTKRRDVSTRILLEKGLIKNIL